MVQIFPPEEEKEEVKVVQVSDEDKMKEYERAAKRLLNARLVCVLSLSLYQIWERIFVFLLWYNKWYTCTEFRDIGCLWYLVPEVLLAETY